MTNKEILSRVEHRPWLVPSETWKYYQEWKNAVFLHWQVDIDELKKFVPEGLEIDFYEEKPWVSLVAFKMENIRPRNFPSFSPISDFHEINIRTYVKKNNKSGVYFLSIEGGTRISCWIARTLSELPYRYSKIVRLHTSCDSENFEFGDRLKIRCEIKEEIIHKSPLDKWLTEKYALFQDSHTSINEFEIHHVEWPISAIDMRELQVEYPRFEKLLSRPPDKTHYSAGVQVLAWDKKQIKKA